MRTQTTNNFNTSLIKNTFQRELNLQLDDSELFKTIKHKIISVPSNLIKQIYYYTQTQLL